ncbi:sulfite exporter TauE/SafE family protein [bacterium]|nr:sulfite exporter TauE/SafE family protein [bacterium]
MTLYIVYAFLGVLIGIISGLVGIGGGTVLVPILIFFFHYSQKEAQGTSLAMLLLPIGIFAVINYFKSGYVRLIPAFIMAVFFVFGGYFGSKWAVQVPQIILRKIFAVFLLLISIYMLLKK